VSARDREPVLETERLIIRKLTTDDAPFILELVNEPSWIRFIGDRGVRTLDAARAYISNGPIAMYERFGFGLYLVMLKGDKVPLGMCGLIKRDALPDVDIGFAFLPRYWGKGYAIEAAAAVLAYGRRALGLGRIVAITSPDNQSSIKLLEKIGFVFEGMIRLPGETSEVRLFSAPP
jgi:RimJ/RimL family protein N-acetyltransferase